MIFGRYESVRPVKIERRKKKRKRKRKILLWTRAIVRFASLSCGMRMQNKVRSWVIYGSEVEERNREWFGLRDHRRSCVFVNGVFEEEPVVWVPNNPTVRMVWVGYALTQRRNHSVACVFMMDGVLDSETECLRMRPRPNENDNPGVRNVWFQAVGLRPPPRVKPCDGVWSTLGHLPPLAPTKWCGKISVVVVRDQEAPEVMMVKSNT